MSATKILNNVRLIQKCMILGRDNKILALKRAAADHSRGGKWDLPGGGYELGENVENAIRREVIEEVGLTAKNPIPFYVTNHMNVKKGLFAGHNVFGICYYCTDWERLSAVASAKEGEVVISSEHTEYQWCTADEFAALDFGQDNGFFVESVRAYLALSHPV